MKTKNDARHILKNVADWTDEELDLIGLSLDDDFDTLWEGYWDIPKRDRRLVEIIEDGSAKTFVYEDAESKPSKVNTWRLNLLKTLRSLQHDS